MPGRANEINRFCSTAYAGIKVTVPVVTKALQNCDVRGAQLL
jgi:hypothetical protein